MKNYSRPWPIVGHVLNRSDTALLTLGRNQERTSNQNSQRAELAKPSISLTWNSFKSKVFLEGGAGDAVIPALTDGRTLVVCGSGCLPTCGSQQLAII